MPIVDADGISPLVVFDIPFIDLTATAAPIGPRVVFDIPFIDLTPTGAVQLNATATFDIPFIDLTARGRIDAEADIFASASFDIPFIDFEANGEMKVEGVAVFDIPFIDFDANASNIALETSELNFIIDILPTAAPGNYIDKWLPRLKVNGVEVPIKGGEYSEDQDSAGASLSVELARPADRSLMNAAAVIDFGFGRKTGGAWDEATFQTLISSGSVRQTGYNVGWDNAPNDNVSVGTDSGVTDRLLRTPATDLVVYDPLRENLDPNDFETLVDTAGNQYIVELAPISGMTLYTLLNEIVVNRAGFSNYKTNLPDFPISRVDCAIGQPFIQSIRGYLGMFDPAIFPVGNELWITDTTIAQPSGFPAPRTLAVSGYRTLAVNQTIDDLDGLIVQYVEDKRAYDYITSRTETATEESGESGDPGYTSTFIQRLYREYRRFSNPAVVLFEELYLEKRDTSAPFVGTINETRENFDFDSNGRMYARVKTTHSRIPDVNNPGTFTLALVDSESERLTYAVHPYQNRSQYVQRRDFRIEGLVAVDSDNQQLGEDFQLDYVTAYRRGNLVEGMTTSFRTKKSLSEKAEPLRNGQVRVKSYEVDHLANIVVNDSVEERSGDVSINGIAPRQSRILVLDDEDAIRSTGRIDTVHAGELPPTQAIPWARRNLKARKTKSRTIEAQTFGYDAGLRKGLLVTITARNIETIGTFLILGRSVPFGREGVFMNLTCKEI